MTNLEEVGPLTPCTSRYIALGNLICIRCERVVSRGINCLKYHLASIDMHDSRKSQKATEEIKMDVNVILTAREWKKCKGRGQN